MKTIKSMLILGIAILSLNSCQNNQEDEEVVMSSENAERNTLSTSTNSGALNYYSYTSYPLSNGTIYDVFVSEKKPLIGQGLDYGTYVRLFIKELPTQNTTFSHRSEADFDVDLGEYFFNNARIGGSGAEEWYAPFVDTRPTAELEVTIENGVATFTVIEAELSDNFITPITSKENFTLSFSIRVDELTASEVPELTELAD